MAGEHVYQQGFLGRIGSVIRTIFHLILQILLFPFRLIGWLISGIKKLLSDLYLDNLWYYLKVFWHRYSLRLPLYFVCVFLLAILAVIMRAKLQPYHTPVLIFFGCLLVLPVVLGIAGSLGKAGFITVYSLRRAFVEFIEHVKIFFRIYGKANPILGIVIFFLICTVFAGASSVALYLR